MASQIAQQQPDPETSHKHSHQQNSLAEMAWFAGDPMSRPTVAKAEMQVNSMARKVKSSRPLKLLAKLTNRVITSTNRGRTP